MGLDSPGIYWSIDLGRTGIIRTKAEFSIYLWRTGSNPDKTRTFLKRRRTEAEKEDVSGENPDV